jgi:hypothetical protein
VIHTDTRRVRAIEPVQFRLNLRKAPRYAGEYRGSLQYRIESDAFPALELLPTQRAAATTVENPFLNISPSEPL